MEEGDVSSSAGDVPPLSSTMLRIKFLIYKNIASIARQQGDYSAAADAYIEVHKFLWSDAVKIFSHLLPPPHPFLPSLSFSLFLSLSLCFSERPRA